MQRHAQAAWMQLVRSAGCRGLELHGEDYPSAGMQMLDKGLKGAQDYAPAAAWCR